MADNLVPEKRIQRIIYLIRGQKVILDRDLAALYEVPTKVLKQAVRRHPDRFPDDFMFVLHRKELANWRSQFVTSNSDRMGLRYPPMAFTEQGVAMLSKYLEQFPRHSGQHRHYARLCPVAPDRRDPRRPVPAAGKSGRKIRRTIQGGLRGNPAADESAIPSPATNWILNKFREHACIIEYCVPGGAPKSFASG